MQVTYLAASDGTVLSKRFFPNPKDTQPYPNILNFNSYSHTVNSLEELYETLIVHAEQGHALLKGDVTKPLVNERRAGSTNPLTPTQYMVLDCDFDQGFDNIDDLLYSLGLHDTDHVIHHSASSGIHSKTGLRAHIFFPLDSSITPPLLKLWTKHINLSIEGLASQLSLNATGLSLKWPLDITVNQNDKLIYIADPICEGIEDPMAGRRFELIAGRGKRTAVINLSQQDMASIGEREARRIDELRSSFGLPKKAASYSTARADGTAFEYLKNPDRAVVTGVRQARGFTYLNLNGGDSWGQYYPDSNPEYLYSFKGDPIVRLQDIDPDYYNAVVKDREAKEDSLHSFIFRNPISDSIHAAEITSGGVDIYPMSRPSIRDFCAERGMQVPAHLPEWRMEFNPLDSNLYDTAKRWINLFKPTEYLLSSYPTPRPCPPIIQRVLRSVSVDAECYNHLCNWIAYIFQNRVRSQTAWIFRGAQGTGKGLLMNRILTPIFGKDHCIETTLPIFSKDFNSYLEQCVFLMLDEGEMNERDAEALLAKTKNLITEPTVTIRRMRTDPYEVPNFTNLIVACNKFAPITIEETDRRWNVAPEQDIPLRITRDEVETIADELPDFCAFLTHYAVDVKAATTPLNNQAKRDLFEATENSIDRIFRALKHGDLDYFIEHVLDAPSTSAMDARFSAYETTVKRIASEFRNGSVVVTNADARNIYEYLTGSTVTPAKFGRLLKIRWGTNKVFKENDHCIRGWSVEFAIKEPVLVTALLNPKKLRIVK